MKDVLEIKLPDGSCRTYPQKGNIVTGESIAASIGKRLAEDAVAIRVNGTLRDLTRPLGEDASIEIITRQDPEGLEILRHDTAHILAEAVKELYPETQITIGPAIENGFYYDFYRKEAFSTEDFETIEKKMREIIDRNTPFEREEWSRDDALTFFKNQGEAFKAELIESIPKGETITLYRQGDFIDLCRGPHLPSTGKIGKHFKLMKLAGAYWRGNSNNPMLQRMYGTAWATEKELKDYLYQLEEAEKRDHRKLGLEMNLFHLQEEARGSIFWHPKGWALYVLLQNYMRKRLSKQGYQEVHTPEILDRSLWEASGHWEKFREEMFVLKDEDRDLALKPMSCPGHIQIFKQGIKSYRDLPLRFSEFGSCHRNEPSGSLHGLMRVRSLVQDDAHIFCTPEQIKEETVSFCALLRSIYKDFGFEDIAVKFSDRPLKRAGSDEVWDKAEKALREAAEASGIELILNPGEGAFYGPKLEFVLKDAIGRDWQLGTLQVDFILPERLGASYVGEDGQKHIPVMIHRAIFGSMERFIGILLEHFAGKLPLWLAPIQVQVLTITSDAEIYGKQALEALKNAGLRAEGDFRNEKISYKIREHSLQKIPVLLIIGKKEAELNQVTLRVFGKEGQETLALSDAVAKLSLEGKGPF
ncbi:MAG: threonine--tRNA ligase [Alphaproteobacteria bacterium 16-39-46]|nr:MAG: threonine--tRNA ligase [Alphaproteobacteria bacterium 16-39-46]OZA42792.1 MAG: threonine--tRNA ligase [Alphaproteobacteria bacterium 17-39-52]HQS84297.1 threonine--tRNA ligase [Alphaproteobacteria bacterium]HQS94131.1 threonine--tRNA ligase [Alphaproteobacteria bacterium]